MNLELNKIIEGDALAVLKTMPDESIDCVITSPPYWALRDYGVAGQLGLEPTFQEYITKLCDIFDEVKRVLKKTGTCWVNLGDTYASGGGKAQEQSWVRNNGSTQGHPDNPSKAKLRSSMGKSLLQIPARFAIEMSDRGWILRNEIIWHKPNCMPASVTDRFTVDFEKVFFFVKSKKYFFNQQTEKATYTDARLNKGNIRYENRETNSGVTVTEHRNKRCVWKIPTHAFKGAHFATFPEALINTMVKAGCPRGGAVLDIFMGAGTTAIVARKWGRDYIGIELNPEYIKIAEKRLSQQILL